MQDMIKEYGTTVAAVLAGGLTVGLIGYACRCITGYMAFFADCLMGG